MLNAYVCNSEARTAAKQKNRCVELKSELQREVKKEKNEKANAEEERERWLATV